MSTSSTNEVPPANPNPVPFYEELIREVKAMIDRIDPSFRKPIIIVVTLIVITSIYRLVYGSPRHLLFGEEEDIGRHTGRKRK